MPTLDTKGNRFYPSLPEITSDSASHTNALQQIKTALRTYQREDQNYLKSFVRFEELVDLGIIDNDGEAIPSTGINTLVDLLDTELTGQAQGDLLFNIDGAEWQHTGSDFQWVDGQYISLGNEIAINWDDSVGSPVELLVFTGEVTPQPEWTNVEFLAPYDGVDGQPGATQFDQSKNNRLLTFSGSGTFSELDDTQAKWGATSAYFAPTCFICGINNNDNGATSDLMSANSWCIETWVRNESLPSVHTDGGHSLISAWAAVGNEAQFTWVINTSGELRFTYSVTGADEFNLDSTGAGLDTIDTWHHVAASYDGSTLRMFSDGIKVYEAAFGNIRSSSGHFAADLSMGYTNDFPGRRQHKGWVDDARVTVGEPVYTEDFAVPTGPHPIGAGGVEGSSSTFVVGDPSYPTLIDGSEITFHSEYTFPTTDGTANQSLVTDGAGNLSFASVGAGGIDDDLYVHISGFEYILGAKQFNNFLFMNAPIVMLNSNPIQWQTGTDTLTLLDTEGATSGDEFTKLLLHFDIADGEMTFKDSSGNENHGRLMGWNSTLSRISSTQSQFGGSSFFVENANGSHLCVDHRSPDLDFGSNDFTIEWWSRPNQTTIDESIIGTIESSNGTWHIWRGNTNLVQFTIRDGTTTKDHETHWPSGDVVGVWKHRAVVRNGDQMYYYVDGVAQTPSFGTGALSAGYTIVQNDNPIRIGDYNLPTGTAFTYDGYIDEVRISNGVARYTANFTPPAAPFEDGYSTNADPFSASVTGLYNFDGVDGATTSTNAGSGPDPTFVGDADLSNTHTIQGETSLYVSGNNDSCVVLDSGNDGIDDFGTGDFTVEFWFRGDTPTNDTTILARGRDVGNISGFAYKARYSSNGNQVTLQVGDGTTIYTLNMDVGNPTTPGTRTQQWQHIALVRSGDTLYGFREGVLEDTPWLGGTPSAGWSMPYDTSEKTVLGASWNGTGYQTECKGYIKNVRITKGVARYTASFRPDPLYGDSVITGTGTVFVVGDPDYDTRIDGLTTNITSASTDIDGTLNVDGIADFNANVDINNSTLTIRGLTGANNVTFAHDDTDLNIVGNNTTDINIAGASIVSTLTSPTAASAAFEINAANPMFAFYETDQAVDEKLWTWQASSAEFGGWAYEDAGGNVNREQWIAVNRTGFTVDSVAFPNGAVNISEALTAASYGGILEANLLDKTAVETVSGEWTFSDAAGNTTLYIEKFAATNTATLGINNELGQIKWILGATGNTDDDLILGRYNDAGTWQGVAFSVDGVTGQVDLGWGVDEVKLSTTATGVQINTDVQIKNGTDFADFSHDGTDFNLTFANTVDWNITDLTGGIVLRNDLFLNFRNSSAVDDGTGIYRATGNALRIEYTGNAHIINALASHSVSWRDLDASVMELDHSANKLRLRSGYGLAILDSTNLDSMNASHDGVDFNAVFAGTTDWNITGLTGGVYIGTGVDLRVGGNVGFYDTAPVAQSAAYTPTNVTTDRAYDANATTTAELADVLGTLIADLQATGLIG